MENRVLRIACLVAVLAAIPGAHLIDMGYPLLSLEIATVTGAFAVAGLLLGLCVARRPLMFYPILGFALAWFASVYWISSMYLEVAAIALAFTVFPLLMRRHENMFLPGATAFFVFWFVSVVFQPERLILSPPLAAAELPAGGSPPPFIHIILDEQMSAAALPETIPQGHPAQDSLKLYLDRGFDVYAKAMSSSEDTQASVSALMSLRDDANNRQKTEGLFTWATKDNAEERALLAGGYRIVALQSDYLQFCTPGPATSCHTHSRADSLSTLAKPDLTYRFRIAAAFLALDQNYRAPHNARSFLLYRGLSKWLGIVFSNRYFGYFSRTPAMLDVVAEAQQGLATIEPGRAFVLHVLVPHFPYMLDQACNLKPVGDWRVPPRYDKRARRDEVYRAYWDQAVCADRLAMELVSAVQGTPFGQQAIIIVHGDHGSRIGRDTPQASREESLQTFLAVKTPASTGKLHTEEVNLQLQFAEEFRKALGLK